MALCRANYPDYNTDYLAKGVLWMDEFIKYPDDLMETAIRGCIKFGKKFPTIADINEAITDLRYEEQVKPKALPWEVKRESDIAQKAREFVQSGKAAEYMQSLDITDLHQYAKLFFAEISAELVLKNYPEFMYGKQCADMCHYCRTDKNACMTQGWIVKHWLDSKSGWVSNQWAKCHKNIK